jgi:MoaA/NifB/PqqE/SkfB family radical SAM enzyme
MSDRKNRKNVNLIRSTLTHLILERPFLPISVLNQAAFSPFLAQLVVTRKCNLRCGYCNEHDPNSEPVPVDVLKERILAINRLGTLAIEFTGGEPLLHPDLIELVRYATSLRFPSRMMISNAFLMTADIIQGLNEAGLMDLQVSIDGVEPNRITHKVLRLLENKLQLLSDLASFRVHVSAVIGASPPEEVLEVIGAAKRFGFIPRVLLIHDGTGQLKLSQSELEAYETSKTCLGYRFKESHGYREKLLHGQEAPYRCRAGARYLYVDEHGMVHWCSQRRGVNAKKLSEYSIDDLKRQFYTAKDCDSFCTVGCSRTTSAYDEWRGQPLHNLDAEGSASQTTNSKPEKESPLG